MTPIVLRSVPVISRASKLKLRGGIAYDQSPVSDAYRTARIPDADRTWLTVGATYQLSAKSSMDCRLCAHLCRECDDQYDGPSPTPGTLVGSYDNSVDILSAQFNHRF